MSSPCLKCTRVKDPQACENKLCKDWQVWYILRWEAMRNHIRAQMEGTQTHDIGIPLGGQRYPNPHRIREYLDEDPCQRCLCPKDVCHTPCQARIAWTQKHNEVRK